MWECTVLELTMFLVNAISTMFDCDLVRYYGGWAAPNIYFLGFAGIIKFGNVRIGGLSGIYKANHYNTGKIDA